MILVHLYKYLANNDQPLLYAEKAITGFTVLRQHCQIYSLDWSTWYSFSIIDPKATYIYWMQGTLLRCLHDFTTIGECTVYVGQAGTGVAFF